MKIKLKPLLQKVLLLAAGALSALFLAEAALRLAGLRFAGRTPGGAPPAGRVKILCAGDSFTYGMGAPKDGNYPAHLQKLIDARYGRGEASVVNAGALAQNSSRLAAGIEALLETHKPDVLLVLTGSVNQSLRGSNFFLLAGEVLPPGERAALKADALLGRYSKLYRFLRVRAELLRAAKAAAYRARPCSPEAERALALGKERSDRGEFESAASALDEGLQADGACAALHFERGRLYFYFREFKPAFKSFRKGRDLDPGHPYVDSFLSQELPLLRPRYADPILDKVLEGDLRAICAAARRAGVMPLVQTYPFTDAARNGIRRDAAAAAGTPLIEHHLVFKPLLAQGKIRRYLSGDEPDLLTSHPNSEGYALMAENVLKTLEALYLFRKPAQEARGR
ncbi:MAG: hypothetical protein NDI60_03965 [Elusimicrobiales bacterium]|nr:hypothetical protein [Elusimicrobiales bacterium]